MVLEAGSTVPDITLESTSGRTVSLTRIKRGIIYFYPKDNTPGCTMQACGFRDLRAEIAAHGWSVYGVSSDPITSHERFAHKHELGFELLSDPNRTAAEAFDVLIERSMFGRRFTSTKRITFAVENGVIANVWNADVRSNAQDVLAWITRSAQTEPF